MGWNRRINLDQIGTRLGDSGPGSTASTEANDMRISRRLTRLSAVVLLGAGLACGDDENGNGTGNGTIDAGSGNGSIDAGNGNGGSDAGSGSLNPACTAAIEARAAEVASELPFSIDDPAEMIGPAGGNQRLEAEFAGKYRDDLANHVGCEPRAAYDANVELLISDNEADVPAGTPATIAGYDCAAKAYDTSNVDSSKPIVILVHGNSASVTSYEEYFSSAAAGTEVQTLSQFSFTVENTVREQLATKLLNEGFEVIGFDARIDRVAELEDFNNDQTTGNPSRNIDHGWAVPLLQSLIRAVMTNNPDREVSLVGHSLGTTVIRDALRRLYIEWRDGEAGAVNPFAQLQDVILASGANHGVSTFALCDIYPNQMRGTVACEMGDRGNFTPTYFSEVNNGPNDLFSTPCADGSYAFGAEDQCEDNVVQYTTITMEDVEDGPLQDEFVSESAARLNLEPCVENVLVGLDDYDRSGYFFTGFWGFFANHFGAIRSDDGMQVIVDRLND